MFNNQDISEKGYNYHRSHQISLVFQNYNLIDYLTPLENLKLVSSKANKDILLQLGLEEEQIKRNIMKLSREHLPFSAALQCALIFDIVRNHILP